MHKADGSRIGHASALNGFVEWIRRTDWQDRGLETDEVIPKQCSLADALLWAPLLHKSQLLHERLVVPKELLGELAATPIPSATIKAAVPSQVFVVMSVLR